MKGNVRTSTRTQPGIESGGTCGGGKAGGNRNKDGDTTRTLHSLVAAVNNANMASVYVTARCASPLEDLVALHPEKIVALAMKDITVISNTAADRDDSPCSGAGTDSCTSTSGGGGGGIDHLLLAALLQAGIDKVYVTAQASRQLQDLIAAYPGTLVAVGLDIANNDDNQITTTTWSSRHSDVSIIVNAAAYDENTTSTPNDDPESTIPVGSLMTRSRIGQRFISVMSRCLSLDRMSSRRSPRKSSCGDEQDTDMLAIGCYPGSIFIQESTPSNEVTFAHLDAFLDCETTESNSNEEESLPLSSTVVAKAIF